MGRVHPDWFKVEHRGEKQKADNGVAVFGDHDGGGVGDAVREKRVAV